MGLRLLSVGKPGKKKSNKTQERTIEVSVHYPEDYGHSNLPDSTSLSALFHQACKLVEPSELSVVLGSARFVVDVLMVCDEEIAVLNEKYLGHKGPTDVLSFTMGEMDPERKAFHLGEVVVSFQTAEREASQRGIELQEEIARYCVHGFLHLLGYEDDTPTGRRMMLALQEKALKGVKNN